MDNDPVNGGHTLADELAALRRRAYGPNADIGTDPVAQARLVELERQFARRGRATSDEAPTGETGDGPGPGVRGPSPPGANPQLDPLPPVPDVPTPPAGRIRRALPFIAIIASVVAVVAVVTLAYERFSRPQPVAHLEALRNVPRGTDLPVLEPQDLQRWEVTDPGFISHGEYGAMDAWEMTGAARRRCLVVSVGGEVVGVGCTAPTIDTVVDVLSVNSWMPEAPEGGRIPSQSTVRFVLHDDAIDVYLGLIDNTAD